jgi:tryptophanase
LEPTGGHAVYINALEAFPHIKREEFPAQSLTAALYLLGGVRGVEIGSLMFGYKDDKGKFVPSQMELVRLAVPRRVYTESHLRYVADIAGEIVAKKENFKGYKIVYEAPFLRHFTVRLEAVS